MNNSSTNTFDKQLLSVVIGFVIFFVCFQVYCICGDFLYDKLNRRRNPELYIQLP